MDKDKIFEKISKYTFGSITTGAIAGLLILGKKGVDYLKEKHKRDEAERERRRNEVIPCGLCNEGVKRKDSIKLEKAVAALKQKSNLPSEVSGIIIADILKDKNINQLICKSCKENLETKFYALGTKANDFAHVKTYSANYKGNIDCDPSIAKELSTDEHPDKEQAENTIRQIAVLNNFDVVYNIRYERFHYESCSPTSNHIKNTYTWKCTGTASHTKKGYR